jgi:hypothetical protein
MSNMNLLKIVYRWIFIILCKKMKTNNILSKFIKNSIYLSNQLYLWDYFKRILYLNMDV